MYRIIKTELWKLKRYHIIWAGILLMLLSVGITLFASTALDGTVWTFPHLVERVIQNNTTTIFPMCITLIAGYIIAREKSDDTLKSIMTIPVSYPALIGGKLIVCGFLSVFLGSPEPPSPCRKCRGSQCSRWQVPELPSSKAVPSRLKGRGRPSRQREYLPSACPPPFGNTDGSCAGWSDPGHPNVSRL